MTLTTTGRTVQNYERRASRQRLWLYLPMVLLAIFFLAPIVFMLVSSFKSDPKIFSDMGSGVSAFLPVGPLTLDNYAEVFRKVPVGRFLINTLFISIVTVALGLVVNSMAGFALARMRWGGKTAVFALIVATLIIPFDAIAVPLLYEVTKLPTIKFDGWMPYLSTNWLNTYHVQIIPFVANAFSIFLFRQFFAAIPVEIDEAARVDGARWFTIYRRIVAPLAGPAFATAAILTFLPAWNQYLWPLIAVQSEDLRPLNVGMDYFFQLQTSWGQVMAYASIIVVPVVIVFLIFQRSFVDSIASTGVKG
jgi:multiple sugar transport system permease protein